jgi:hypothetical protein
MTKLQQKDTGIARLNQRVAELEGLIEQVLRLHHPERWKALELEAKRSKLLAAMDAARAQSITWGQGKLALTRCSFQK